MLITNPADLVGYYTVKETGFTSTTTATKVLNADPRRVGLHWVGATGANNSLVWPTSNVSTTRGYQLTFTTPVIFYYARDGALVEGEWWLINGGSTLAVACLEIIWRPPTT